MNNSIANYNVVSGCKIYISTFYKIIYNFLYDKVVVEMTVILSIY